MTAEQAVKILQKRNESYIQNYKKQDRYYRETNYIIELIVELNNELVGLQHRYNELHSKLIEEEVKSTDRLSQYQTGLLLRDEAIRRADLIVTDEINRYTTAFLETRDKAYSDHVIELNKKLTVVHRLRDFDGLRIENIRIHDTAGYREMLRKLCQENI